MILLIGCGNSLRKDDGAGLVLAELLERSWQLANSRVQRISVHQLTPELAERIAAKSVSVVVFFDSRLTTEMQGKCVVEVHPLALTSSSSSLAHHCNPETVMLYACWLYGKKVPSWKVAIGGRDFAHGEGLSPMAQEAIAEALDVACFSPHAWLTRMAAKTLHRQTTTPMLDD